MRGPIPSIPLSRIVASPFKPVEWFYALSVVMLLCAWPASGGAQDKAAVPTGTEAAPTVGPDSTTRPGAAPGRQLKTVESAPGAGTPFQAGSFLVYPEFDLTWLYDSNVYFSNTSPVTDHAFIYSPAVWVQSNWSQHALNFHAAADATRYSQNSTENSDDYRISTEGRYDFSGSSNIYGGARISKDHEERESPDSRNGLTPTQYRQYRYYGGLFNQVDRVSVRIAGTAQRLDYSDVYFQTGGGAIQPINNDDRDRWQYTGGVRVGYEMSPRLEPYAQIAFDNRRYKDAIDDLGYQRDSDGQRYLVGAKWNIPKTLKLDAFAGYLKQDYADPRLSDVTSPVAGAALLWAVADKTTMSAYLDRTVEETTVTQTPAPGVTFVSSSYLNTYASVGINHRINDAWSVRAGGSLSRVAYEGIDRNDKYYDANLGATYRLHRNLILDTTLSERKLDSSIPTEDFSKRTVFVRAIIPFSY